MTLEEFLDKMREYEQQPKIWRVDPVRQMEFQQAYKGIQKLVATEDPDATIDCEMHELNDGSAVIRVNTDWLTVREIEKFCKAINKASNFEIYPKNNGTVQFNIMFNQVYKRLY